MRALIVFSAFLLVPAATAFAHGGAYRGPVPLPPDALTPQDPSSVPTPSPRGPLTPGGRGPSTTFPGRGPQSPALPGAGGRTAGRPSASAPSAWSSVWYLSRESLLDLATVKEARRRARTTPREADDRPAGAAREAALAALRIAARDSDPDVATGAIIALGKAADLDARPLLVELVDARGVDRTVNESAALALGLVGGGDPETRRFLERVVADPRRPTRARAFAAIGLGFLGEQGALPALMATSRRSAEEDDVRIAAVHALGLLGNSLVAPDLALSLSGPAGRRDPDEKMRAWYAAALGRLGTSDAIPALAAALADPDADVRRQAAASLGVVATPEHATAVKALRIALASDPDSTTRGFAALSLGRMGAPVPRDLAMALEKGETVVKGFAALGLGLLLSRDGDGAGMDDARAFLRSEFRDAGAVDRKCALASAIGIAGIREAAPAFRAILADRGDPELRACVAVALGLLGDEKAGPILREVLEEKVSPALVREAALSLALLGDPHAVRILLDLLAGDSTEYVKAGAAAALGHIADPESTLGLVELLGSKGASPSTRAFAAVALGMILDPRPSPVLARAGDPLNPAIATGALRELLTIL